MQKPFTLTGFIVACMLAVYMFLTAENYTQLGAAVLIYPVLVYFAYKLFIDKKSDLPAFTVRPSQGSTVREENNTNPQELNTKTVQIVDIDKRAFLKLIGGIGISYFLFSFLNRKAVSFFSGQTGGLGSTLLGNTSPSGSTSSATDGYRIAEIDDTGVNNTFYGFTNTDGYWFIMKENYEDNSFRYSRGKSNFSENWDNRNNLKYDYYYNLF